MRHLAAYSFRSPLSLADALDSLNSAGPWRWIERENDSWGDYISTGVLAKPHFGVVKIIQEESAYIILVHLRVENEDGAATQKHFDAVHRILDDAVFPNIKASEIEETDFRER